MNSLTDQQLLGDYVQNRSEGAFAELVRRHIDLVHSAAVRMTGEPHSAQDVTQAVFVTLAQNAGGLVRHPVLSGWLHTTARNLAAKAVRTAVRRQQREQEAVAMNELLSSTSDAPWEQIAPHLDAALGELTEPDRDALLLRYFEKKSAAEIGSTLGISSEAAQKRISRAVERLREFFAKRGVSVGAGGLVVVISANAVQAAPVGLAVTISAAALAGTAATTSTLIAATTKTIAMTTLQKTLVTATVAVLAGAGIYQARQAAQLRDQNLTLQQQQAPLAEQLRAVQDQNLRLSNQVAAANDQQSLSKAEFNELLRLRGQKGQTQTALQELAKARAALEQNNQLQPDRAALTNAMATGLSVAEKSKLKAVVGKVTRMKEGLHLTDDQAQAINDLMVRRIKEDGQRLLQAMSHGKLTDLQMGAANPLSQDDEIKGLLTSEQLAQYDAFKNAEAQANAEKKAKAEVQQMSEDLNLSPEQQAKIQAWMVQKAMEKKAPPEQDAVALARASGDVSTLLGLKLKADQQGLEEKMQALSGILTPEQLKKYQQSQAEEMEMANSAIKMFLPKTNSVTGQ